MQQWFTLSDSAMKVALHHVPLFREFAGPDNLNTLLPGESSILRFRHQGAEKRPDARPKVKWHIAMRPGRRSVLDLSSPLAAMIDKSQQILTGIRARVEHSFRVIKRHFPLGIAPCATT